MPDMVQCLTAPAYLERMKMLARSSRGRSEANAVFSSGLPKFVPQSIVSLVRPCPEEIDVELDVFRAARLEVKRFS